MGNRVLVGVLAAVDAVVVAAAGLGAVLAPLTLMWVFGFGDQADWATLWPAAARVWELGHLVPIAVALPAEYAVAAGVQSDAATFALSLAPLGLALCTAVFAARSGSRAAAAGAAWTGAATGAVVFAVIATAVLLTSANPVGTVVAWQAVLLPAVVFAVPGFLGALVGAWRHGDDGFLDRLRTRLGPRWEPVPSAAARAAGMSVVGVVAASALLLAGLVVARGGEVVALFQAGHIDPLGATVVTLGQLAYLPTLVVWAGSFLAGPGFALGAGTVVSPAATQLPIVPGIPVLGVVPPAGSPWLLLLALVPVVLGALAGHRLRRDLEGGGLAPCLVGAAATGVVAGLAGALAAVVAGGALGPGRLAVVGPDPLAVGIALGAEVLVGAFLGVAIVHRAPREEPAEEQPSALPDLMDAAERLAARR